MSIAKSKKCKNCWFYHKGKHKSIDNDGIIRDFDGICSNIAHAEILPLKVMSVFENDDCELHQHYMDVIRRIIKNTDNEQKTLDNLGGNVENTQS